MKRHCAIACALLTMGSQGVAGETSEKAPFEAHIGVGYGRADLKADDDVETDKKGQATLVVKAQGVYRYVVRNSES